MYVDYGARNSGKTTRLIEWLKEDVENRMIVVPTGEAFSQARQMALMSGLSLEEIKQHIRLLDDLIFGRFRGLHIKEIRIDEIQFLLSKLDHHINGFTISFEKE